MIIYVDGLVISRARFPLVPFSLSLMFWLKITRQPLRIITDHSTPLHTQQHQSKMHNAWQARAQLEQNLMRTIWSTHEDYKNMLLEQQEFGVDYEIESDDEEHHIMLEGDDEEHYHGPVAEPPAAKRQKTENNDDADMPGLEEFDDDEDPPPPPLEDPPPPPPPPPEPEPQTFNKTVYPKIQSRNWKPRSRNWILKVLHIYIYIIYIYIKLFLVLFTYIFLLLLLLYIHYIYIYIIYVYIHIHYMIYIYIYIYI